LLCLFGFAPINKKCFFYCLDKKQQVKLTKNLVAFSLEVFVIRETFVCRKLFFLFKKETHAISEKAICSNVFFA
jgi:hypothetical protein